MHVFDQGTKSREMADVESHEFSKPSHAKELRMHIEIKESILHATSR